MPQSNSGDSREESNDYGGGINDRGLGTPLLTPVARSSVISISGNSSLADRNRLSIARSSGRAPPSRAFAHGTATDGNWNDQDDDNAEGPESLMNNHAPTPTEQEQHAKQLSIRILGRPYASKLSFWLRSIPMALLVGCLVPLLAIAFITVTTTCKDMWLRGLEFPTVDPNNENASVAEDNFFLFEVASPQRLKGSWKWLYVTTFGGFLSGLMLLLPGAPPIMAFPSFISDIADLSVSTSSPGTASGGNQRQLQRSAATILASAVALTTGAPLGPEVAISQLASLLVYGMTWMFQVDERCKAIWKTSSLSSALALFVPSAPLFGPMAVQELAQSCRPDHATIDSMVLDKLRAEQDDVPMEVLHALRPDVPDYMEVLTVQALSASVTVLMMRWLVGAGAVHFVQDRQDELDYTPYYLDTNILLLNTLAAIPIGVLCGLIGASVLLFTSTLGYLRKFISKRLVRIGIPPSLLNLFFTTLAGTLHGLLTIASPYATADWWSFLRAAVERDGQALAAVLGTGQLALNALAKTAGIGVCLGLGLVGGHFIPLLVVGACVGHVLASWIGFLPLSLALPCCMIACPVSIFPIPISAVITASILLQTSVEETAPILTASLVAWMVTGGLGIIRRFEACQLESRAIVVNGLLSRDLVEDEEDGEVGITDDEIIRNIRSSIFGSA